MTDILEITLQDQWYREDTGTEKVYDTSMFGNMVGADIGYGVTEDGEPLQSARYDRLEETVLEDPVAVENMMSFHERHCVTDREVMTDDVKLADDSTVNVGDYDVILICHFWLHHAYTEYLLDEYPDKTFIGIIEESVQDITYSSSSLQMTHFRTISKLDGFITSTKQLRDWLLPKVDNVMYMPLPVPEGQFEGEPKREDSDEEGRICVGVSTFDNLHANFYSNLLVLDRLRRDGHDVEGEIVGIRDRQRPVVDSYEEEFDNLTVHGFIESGLYDFYADMEFAVLLTNRATVGRASAELAGVGVPCIGNANNDMQSYCWPELSIDPYDTKKAVSLAKRLRNDPEFYRRNVERARRAIRDLQDHESYERRLKDYIESVHDA
jgi:glycosyltransferase involved in cell wall biosynthesis